MKRLRYLYEVRYTRKDGSFGGFCGFSKTAFNSEVRMCESAGFEYEAIIKKIAWEED